MASNVNTMANKKIEWKYKKVKASELKEHPDNARQITTDKFEKLTELIENLGFNQPCVVNADMTIIAGHQRRKSVISLEGPDAMIDIAYPSRQLTDEEVDKMMVGDNLFRGAFDIDKLRNVYDADQLLKLGFQKNELNLMDKLKSPALGDGVAAKTSKSSISVNVEKTTDETPVFTVVIQCTDPDHQKRVMKWLAEHGYDSNAITS